MNRSVNERRVIENNRDARKLLEDIESYKKRERGQLVHMDTLDYLTHRSQQMEESDWDAFYGFLENTK